MMKTKSFLVMMKAEDLLVMMKAEDLLVTTVKTKDSLRTLLKAEDDDEDQGLFQGHCQRQRMMKTKGSPRTLLKTEDDEDQGLSEDTGEG
ncbi:hypothetical protein llap_22557 [Limosa lapponica baueri]|uniref:Uncharacterized protein n=1 Tax=Limosa lapponica baueri TaxID=1758121 RepID=A0A2I0T014_LIMLA|nr:hypothetical protein llap_22557 [Limosa lapponica baueri]